MSNQTYGSGIVTDTLRCVQRRSDQCMIERCTSQVHPLVVQFGVRLTYSPPLVGQESLHIKATFRFNMS